MKVLHSFEKRLKSSVVSVGMFDGVHIAHQKILKSVVRDASLRSARSVVLTFAEHPQAVMRRAAPPGLITTVSQKIKLFERLGVSHAVLVHFNASFSKIRPKAFVERLLMQKLGMQKLCVGYDFAFGKDRSGDLKLLASLSKQFGFTLRIFPPIKRSAMKVSSTSIRKLLLAGRLQKARQFLGRWYAMQGVVEKGLGLGKKLGFPTANVRMFNDNLLPHGVYAVFAKGPGFARPGVLNVGVRPTLSTRHRKSKRPVWELHLWGFSKNLYGKHLEVHFVKHMRPERKFASLNALRLQIARDVSRAKKILRSHAGPIAL